MTPSQGTYFQLLDYSAISGERDVDFARRLTREAGVACIPVSVFCANRPAAHWLRFCFAKDADTLRGRGGHPVQDLNVTAASRRRSPGRTRRRTGAVRRHHRQPARTATDLVVLPEMFTTGFTMDPAANAEDMDGPTVAWLATPPGALGWRCAGVS